MDIVTGEDGGWRWANGWVRSGVHQEVIRGVADSFPVFAFVLAHQSFGLEQSLTRVLAEACDVASRELTVEDLTATLEELVRAYPADPEDHDTTVAAEVGLILVDGATASFAQIGGHAIYLRSKAGSQELARPHTLIHDLLDHGRITFADALTHQPRIGLTKLIWGEQKQPTDWDRGRVKVAPRDRVLMVTTNLSWAIEGSGRALIDDGPASVEDAVQMLLSLDPNDPQARGAHALVLERA